jgi:hypothetical protein
MGGFCTTKLQHCNQFYKFLLNGEYRQRDSDNWTISTNWTKISTAYQLPGILHDTTNHSIMYLIISSQSLITRKEKERKNWMAYWHAYQTVLRCFVLGVQS